MLLRERLAHELDVIKHRFAAAPRFVPVITNTPNILRRFRISQDRLRALVNEISIVIPNDDLLLAESFLLDRWSKMVLEEVAFVLGRVDARLPLLRRHRLVLNTDAPDRNAFALVSSDELHEVVGPRLIELRFQLAAAQHVVVVFHERRRAPRAREDVEPVAGRRDYLLDKGNAEFLIVRDAERLQLFVAFVDVGVTAAREVATVNVRARECVADARLATVVCVEKFLLLWFR